MKKEVEEKKQEAKEKMRCETNSEDEDLEEAREEESFFSFYLSNEKFPRWKAGGGVGVEGAVAW